MEHINLEFFCNLEREGKKSVVDFCIKMGFIASSYECPECKKPMTLTDHKDRNQDGFAWYCRHKNRVKRSIRNGSWFQESRLSITMMLKLAYLWVKRTTYAWITDELKTTQATVCEWMGFFRRVCLNAIKKEGNFIGGPGNIVEIDAKSFSNVKNKKRETWVFGGVDRSTKHCFLEIIQSGEKEEIISILQKYVLPGTTIISDNWKGFDCLESNGYVHQKVSKFAVKDSATGAHKNNILCLWARVKKITGRRIVNDQFETYLAEIVWRRLHTNKTQELLKMFFKALCDIFTPQIRDDHSHILKKLEREKKKKEDFAKTQLQKMNGNTNEEQGETRLMEVNGDNNEKETQLKEVNGNINKEQGENTCDMQIFGDEFIGEVEVPLLFSEDSLSEDESEGENENGSQNKRQKTMDSLDT